MGCGKVIWLSEISGNRRAGAEARLILLALLARLNSLAPPNFWWVREKQTSGPKGRVDYARLSPGINPRPTAPTAFFTTL